MDWLLFGLFAGLMLAGVPLAVAMGLAGVAVVAAADLGIAMGSGTDAATAAVSVICAQQGVWAVRTHEVRGQRDAIAVVERIRRP